MLTLCIDKLKKKALYSLFTKILKFKKQKNEILYYVLDFIESTKNNIFIHFILIISLFLIELILEFSFKL